MGALVGVANMADVLIPFNGSWLVLSQEQLGEAMLRGREIAGQLPQQPCIEAAQDRVLDADGMQTETGIPASWFLEQARQKKVPHVRAGKYVRFRLNEVLEALSIEPRPGDRLSVGFKKRNANQQVAVGCYQPATRSRAV